MRLNGKDLRVLPGGIMVFLHVPFGHVKKMTISNKEKKFLETAYWRIADLGRQLYETYCTGIMSTSETISCRLRQSGDLEFSLEDLELLSRVLKQVIEEDRPEASHNVYFNGDQYGITLDDFNDLLTRIESELDALRTNQMLRNLHR